MGNINHSVKSKISKVLAFTLLIVLAACLSYLAVYKLSFLPNGYDLVSQQKAEITVKSFNAVGIGKGSTTLSFSENDLWKIDDIKQEIKRQKYFLCLLFVAGSSSMIILILNLREGQKLWRAIWGSRIMITTLFPLFIIVSSLNRIQDLIS